MTQATDIFDLLIKLTPPVLALLLWAYGVYNQSSLKNWKPCSYRKGGLSCLAV